MSAGCCPGMRRRIWQAAGRRRTRRRESRSRDTECPWEEEGRVGRKRCLRMKRRNDCHRQSCLDMAKANLSAEETRRRCGPYSWCPEAERERGKVEEGDDVDVVERASPSGVVVAAAEKVVL